MFFTEKNRKKNLSILSLAFLLSCGAIFLASTSDVHAGSVLDKAADVALSALGGGGFVVGFLINSLLYPFFVFAGWLASLALSIFEWAVKPESVTILFNNPGVYESWKFIRDFFNLFFILILLYIAFMVIFQIEKNFKKTLLSLVLAALFINFSYPISRALIDMTNVPMYFFTNQMMGRSSDQGTGIFGGALTATNLEKIILPGSNNGSFTGAIEASYKNPVSRLLMAIVFMFIFSITLLVLSVMFVIRLVVLVMLVIFSSVGFAASIVPGLSSYSKMWWENFWKYAFFGPAAMLMILVATRFFAAMGGENGSLMKSMKIVTSGTVATGPDQSFFASMALFSIPIIMLWTAMTVANKFSIAGASSVVGMGEKVAKWAGKAALSPIPWGFRKYEKAMTSGKHSKFTKFLAPTAVYKGFEHWRKDAHEKDHSPVEQAGAEIADKFSRLPLQDHTDLAFKNYSANIAKEQKEIAAISTNSDYVIHELIEAIKAGDDEKTIGAIQILGAQNDFNDMMHAMERIQEETGKKFGKDGKLATNDMSSENAKEAIKNMMLQTGTSPELAAKAMLNISNGAIAAGNVGMAGAARFNGKEFVISNEEEQAGVAAAKLQNLETQARQRTLHHNAIFKEEDSVEIKDADGKVIGREPQFGDLNGLVGEKVLGTIGMGDIAEARRSRDDLKREVAERMEVIRLAKASGATDKQKEAAGRLEKMQASMDSNAVVKKYFETLYALYKGIDYESQKPVDKDLKPITGSKEEKDSKDKGAPQPGDTISKGGIHIPAGSKTA